MLRMRILQIFSGSGIVGCLYECRMLDTEESFCSKCGICQVSGVINREFSEVP